MSVQDVQKETKDRHTFGGINEFLRNIFRNNANSVQFRRFRLMGLIPLPEREPSNLYQQTRVRGELSNRLVFAGLQLTVGHSNAKISHAGIMK